MRTVGMPIDYDLENWDCRIHNQNNYTLFEWNSVLRNNDRCFFFHMCRSFTTFLWLCPHVEIAECWPWLLPCTSGHGLWSHWTLPGNLGRWDFLVFNGEIARAAPHMLKMTQLTDAKMFSPECHWVFWFLLRWQMLCSHEVLSWPTWNSYYDIISIYIHRRSQKRI